MPSGTTLAGMRVSTTNAWITRLTTVASGTTTRPTDVNCGAQRHSGPGGHSWGSQLPGQPLSQSLQSAVCA